MKFNDLFGRAVVFCLLMMVVGSKDPKAWVLFAALSAFMLVFISLFSFACVRIMESIGLFPGVVSVMSLFVAIKIYETLTQEAK